MMTDDKPGVADALSLDVDAALGALQPCRPKVRARIEQWPLHEPFRISNHVFETLDVLLVSLECDGLSGRGEAAGVYYLGDTPETMLRQVEEACGWIEKGVDHALLHERLPQGGARNALDCALWDVQAKRIGQPVWSMLGMAPPHALITTFTIGADTPAVMADHAIGYAQARALKIKLMGDTDDAARIASVRAARPDVWLAVDANRGMDVRKLEWLQDMLVKADVSLLEQPFPVGQDAALACMSLPCPVAADESVQGLESVDELADRYQLINIKIDKCGGLTEGLRMAQRARQLGLDVMVGNMLGSSLAMAPAWLLGQFCTVVDLDGPIFLKQDCSPAVEYRDGFVSCLPGLWGNPV